MSADPDDSFTLDMIDSAEPRVEMSDAEKAKARNGGAFKARLLGFLAPSAKPRAWRREPVLISPRAPPRPRDSTKLDLPETDLPEIDPAEISAEASSESRRAPTYEELWREPRRLA
ncbi:MAG: hypothetical protein WAK66_06945, partial [Methylocystis sp.]